MPGSDALSHVTKDVDNSLLVQTESHHRSVQCLPKWQRVITDFFQMGSIVQKVSISSSELLNLKALLEQLNVYGVHIIFVISLGSYKSKG